MASKLRTALSPATALLLLQLAIVNVKGASVQSREIWQPPPKPTQYLLVEVPDGKNLHGLINQPILLIDRLLSMKVCALS